MAQIFSRPAFQFTNFVPQFVVAQDSMTTFLSRNVNWMGDNENARFESYEIGVDTITVEVAIPYGDEYIYESFLFDVKSTEIYYEL